MVPSKLQPDPQKDGPFKVLIVISELGLGGAERQVIYLANEAHRFGVQVDICSLSDHIPGAEFLDRPESLHVIPKARSLDPFVIPKLIRLIKQNEYDLLHGFLFDAEVATRIVRLVTGRIVVLGSERNSDYTPRWYRKLILRTTMSLADGIIANSECGARHHQALYSQPEKLYRVVRNGVDTDRFIPQEQARARHRLSIATDDFVVGMFASFKPQKNHEMLVRSIQQFAESTNRPFKVILVGDAPYGANDTCKRAISDAINASHSSSHYIWLGSRPDVADLYTACDVTVLPSRHEGTPNVALESMACGVPVIATRVADNDQIVLDGKTGFIVDLDDDSSMTKAMLEIAHDPVLARNLGREARSHATDHLSIPIMCASMTETWKSFIGTSK